MNVKSYSVAKTTDLVSLEKLESCKLVHEVVYLPQDLVAYYFYHEVFDIIFSPDPLVSMRQSTDAEVNAKCIEVNDIHLSLLKKSPNVKRLNDFKHFIVPINKFEFIQRFEKASFAKLDVFENVFITQEGKVDFYMKKMTSEIESKLIVLVRSYTEWGKKGGFLKSVSHEVNGDVFRVNYNLNNSIEFGLAVLIFLINDAKRWAGLQKIIY